MLSVLELEIVKKNKEWGFGAYLQWAWFEYPSLQRQINNYEYPVQERLLFANNRMKEKQFGFDCCYIHMLPKADVNPLKVEMEAWTLLSPLVKHYVDEFGAYIDNYSVQTADKGQLLSYVKSGWELLQKWDIISDSYKAKYDKNWSMIEEMELSARVLIQEISSKSH